MDGAAIIHTTETLKQFSEEVCEVL